MVMEFFIHFTLYIPCNGEYLISMPTMTLTNGRSRLKQTDEVHL